MKMKLFICFFLVIWLTSCSDFEDSYKTGMEGKPLPSFNLLLMDSSTNINTADIPAGKPIVFLFMSPDCPYCKTEITEITKEINSLNDIRFYIFSIFPFESIKAYYNHYELDKFKNITVGQDYEKNFEKYYKVPGVPYTVIYNKDKLLKQIIIGKTSPDKIKDILSK